MIRGALIALGLTAAGIDAGAAQAQGMVDTAPILETCGGTRLVLEPVGDAEADDIARAAEVVSRRMGGWFSQIFNYTMVEDGQIIVSLPRGLGGGIEDIAPLLESVDFGFHDVTSVVSTGASYLSPPDNVVLIDAQNPATSYILKEIPFLDGATVREARPIVDNNNRPALQFSLTEKGAEIFAAYTADNIGSPVAIVMRGEVLSAPVIQTVITGGELILTGDFTSEELTIMAAILAGGLLPFDLDFVSQTLVDGSDPSADFCP